MPAVQHRAVGARSLVRVILSRARKVMANALILVDRAVFAPSAQEPNIVGEVWLAAKEILGYLDQSQILPIPRYQVQIAIEHQGAARHVFEDGTGHRFAVADARDEELRGLRH